MNKLTGKGLIELPRNIEESHNSSFYSIFSFLFHFSILYTERVFKIGDFYFVANLNPTSTGGGGGVSSLPPDFFLPVTLPIFTKS